MEYKIIPLIAILFAYTLVASPVFADYSVQTKTKNCTANQILQDSDCTPGAVLTTDKTVVCKTGYTKTVRAVSESTKKKVFVEYGIPYSQHSNYEVDHLISLELGGGNDISNLWPENSTIKNGSLSKDNFENYLHNQVCSGKMTLDEAQKEISSNWVLYYQAVSAGKPKTTTNVTATPAPATIKTIVPVATPATVDHPAGETGKCNDGTYTSATNHKGACSKHGGVEKWF